MVGESRSVLPPAKRLKTEEGETLPAADEMSAEAAAAAEEEGETLPAADEMSTETPAAAAEEEEEEMSAEEGETLPAADEMSTETPAAAEEEEEEEEMSMESLHVIGWPWSPSEDLKPYHDPDDDTPFDKMMDAYDSLDHELSNPLGYEVAHRNPLNDKEYLFPFCKLMSDENYLKVLADKDIIYSWGHIRGTLVLYHSSSALPESLGIAKKIVDEHKMALDMEDMLSCLKDLAADWCWRMRIRGIKEFGKFLLRFWEENRKAPTAAEINEFCKEWKRATSAKFGARAPIAITDGDIREGWDIVWLLREGISTAEELEKEIEAKYKEKLSEILICRAHYIRRKLDEAEKSDLAKEIVEHYPAFGKLDVPRMEMEPWGLDKDQLLEH